jgi:pilus assembly protein CpaF
MEMIHQVLQEETSRGYLSLREKASIGRELFNAFRKLDILQEILEDNEVTEIMINGTENIFIEKDGKILQLQKRFTDRRRLEDVIQQMVGKTND